jgi:hypothetical protein
MSRLVALVDGLMAYLAHPATSSNYPGIAGLALNVFEAPEPPQHPLLDIHPVGEDVLGAEDGGTGEAAVGLLEFLLQVEAAQYTAAVRAAFNHADALRLALNSPRAAQYAGVAWVRLISTRQAVPDRDKGRVFVNLTGQLRAKYSIQAR